jgi:hypothetical protein
MRKLQYSARIRPADDQTESLNHVRIEHDSMPSRMHNTVEHLTTAPRLEAAHASFEPIKWYKRIFEATYGSLPCVASTFFVPVHVPEHDGCHGTVLLELQASACLEGESKRVKVTVTVKGKPDFNINIPSVSRLSLAIKAAARLDAAEDQYNVDDVHKSASHGASIVTQNGCVASDG